MVWKNARPLLAPAALAVLATLPACGDDDDSTSTAEDLIDPPIAASSDGVLDIDLTIEPTEITVRGKTFISNVYNGMYLPPVLVVRRGDEVRIDLTNRIGPADMQIDGAQSTNIHYHGFDISPKPPADDPFLHLGATEGSNVFEYRWTVPDNHPQGDVLRPHR